MRIAHFCDSHPDRPDGVATAVAATVSLLRGAGHEVQLYQPAPLLGGRGEPYRVRSVPVPLREIRFGVPRFAARRPLPDIVHIHTTGPIGIGGLRYARGHRIPVVMTWHIDLLAYSAFFPEIQIGAALAALHLRLGWTARDYLRLIRPGTGRQDQLLRLGDAFMDRVSLILAPSDKTAASLAGFARTPPVRTVPTSLTLADDPLDRTEIRRTLGIPPAVPVVLAVGRATPEKNPSLLLASFAQLLRQIPDAQLVMLGVRQRRRALLRLAREVGVVHALRIVPPVPHARMGGYYRMSDVLAFASTTDTQGLVLLEAEQVGLPLVLADPALATRPGANPNEAQVGRLSTPPRAAPFAAALCRVLCDPELHQRLAEAGRDAAAAYPASRYLDQLLAAYSSVHPSRRIGPRRYEQRRGRPTDQPPGSP
ncbi:Glycosyltransferase involved in cell wall bisynthesis [Micromonospora phaseoli]|uniref:Glycosyltransferase involved in cell wall bisynthesis n=1 Tax=Micromonospora phaseoli TaxID=1144548 RepID=A0A1H6S519_9ACTN|nr:glycosyltransferase [Micromonospora phaseoli]PZW03805.1 glycosyltransferase involved in cell wall biosynthesis [Micromonospora phaseoli]GIJ79107.1 glycosyl transferase [Micromonospora phaseoli]SEI62999.1 Glycosyltransferase involved in cell wall bisynthesis [Micromonospora phaseoli]